MGLCIIHLAPWFGDDMNKLTIFTNMAKKSSLIARMLIYKIWDFNARLATELKLVTDYVVFSKTEGF